MGRTTGDEEHPPVFAEDNGKLFKSLGIEGMTCDIKAGNATTLNRPRYTSISQTPLYNTSIA
jgi:hypothetical protein